MVEMIISKNPLNVKKKISFFDTFPKTTLKNSFKVGYNDTKYIPSKKERNRL